ncbi:MAG: hypothetical protein ACK4RX_01780 [Chitinophagaceae bacterium]
MPLIVSITSLAVHQRSGSFVGTFLEQQESTDKEYELDQIKFCVK